jgi:hypothetical protein
MPKSALPIPKTKLGTALLICAFLWVMGQIGELALESAQARHRISLDTEPYWLAALAIPVFVGGLGVPCLGAVWIYRWLKRKRSERYPVL